MHNAQTTFDLAIHLVAGAAAEAHDVPIEEVLHAYGRALSRHGVITDSQLTSFEQIVGRLDPAKVWAPANKGPRGGSFTADDLASQRGEHNLVHWLTNELARDEQFKNADLEPVIGFIRGRLQTHPT